MTPHIQDARNNPPGWLTLCRLPHLKYQLHNIDILYGMPAIQTQIWHYAKYSQGTLMV